MGVLTAPLGIVKVAGNPIGTLKTISFAENYTRGAVQGVGRLNKSEIPATAYVGTINASYYVIDFRQHPFGNNALLRVTGNVKDFINTVILGETGFDLDILKKVPDVANFPQAGKDANGVSQVEELIIAKITNIFITSDNFDLNEGQIAGRNGTFEFLDPIVHQL